MDEINKENLYWDGNPKFPENLVQRLRASPINEWPALIVEAADRIEQLDRALQKYSKYIAELEYANAVLSKSKYSP